MRTLLFTLLSLLSLCSCFTPRTVVRLDANEPDIKWSYGRQVVEQKRDSLESHIYFDTYNKQDLIFDVELTNWGSEDVLVSPERMYLRCSEDGIKRQALDPEAVLLEEEIERSRRDANAKNLAVAVGVAAVAGAVAIAATSDGNSGNNSNSDNNVLSNVASTIIVSNYVIPPLPAPVLPPSLDFWANFSLRKTTLEQGYKVGGKVVVPRLDFCPGLELVVPLGDETFVARFKQEIIKP